MITAREKGRHLELIVGGGDDMLSFLVPPISAKTGAKLLSDFVGVAFAQVEGQEALDTAASLAETALGTEVFEQIQDLRWAEQEQITNAAFMWNVQGGGIDLVNEYLAGGLGKARETLLRAVGLWEAFSLLETSLVSEWERLTSSAVSLDTSTPAGGVTSP